MTASSHGDGPGTPRSLNRLASETSPYLLQHAANPVDWYPWGPEALARAKAESKPIFLSIGYSACHWCHVMERESFENPDIAAVMNERFVNIKVDREERPDLDHIYMSAVMAMTGSGGWPMSVFLTPDLEPFFGGTYFPPTDSRGMAGFPRVLLSVHRAWVEKREEINQAAAEMTDRLRSMSALPAGEGDLTVEMLDRAARVSLQNFDSKHGGFGHAPKFPHPMDLRVLLRHHARTGDTHALHAVKLSLEKMARGGIYDHLGGGFARYSTDARWLVPHFEKMLYDNALLTSTYLEAYQVTGQQEFARVARETIAYVLGRMTDPDGAFYSTEDADSDGVEGKYYVWSIAEIAAILGSERARTFCDVYDVTPSGNWEGHNILNLTRGLEQAAAMLGREQEELATELAESRAQLLAVRGRRIAPAKDTKVIVAWNGLMLAALAEAGHILAEPKYLDAARRAAGFLLTRLRQPDGRLLHTYKDGVPKLDAYLDDYANLIDGLTRLYEATGETRWLNSALQLSTIMIDEFSDPEHGGFFYTGNRHETLITRTKDIHDNATPSGNAMAATALLRLGAITGLSTLTDAGRATLMSLRLVLEHEPAAAGQSMIALDFLLNPVKEFAVISGDDSVEFQDVLRAIARRFNAGKVVVPATVDQAADLGGSLPLLVDRTAREGRTTTYVCENFACQAPVVGVAGIEEALAGLTR